MGISMNKTVDVRLISSFSILSHFRKDLEQNDSSTVYIDI